MTEYSTNHSNAENPSVFTQLKKSRLLNPLPEPFLKKLSSLLSLTRYAESQPITREGEANSEIFFLLKGKVSVYSKGEFILSLKRLGDMCGEMSVITNKPCFSSEIAETPVEMFCLDMKEVLKQSVFDTRELQDLLFKLYSAMLSDKLTMATMKASLLTNTEEELIHTEALLADALKESARAHQVKSGFLDTINHELRTPMHGVMGMTSLLTDTPLTNQQTKYARIIQQSADALMNAINDMLNVATIDTDTPKTEQEVFELRRLLDKLIFDTRVKVKEKKLNLAVTFDDTVSQLLQGETTRLYQVLINLSGYAIDHSQSDVRIHVSKLAEEFNRATLRFSIDFEAAGMSPETRNAMAKGADASLSLVISRQLIGIMDGEFGIISGKDSKLVFWFLLEFAQISDRRKNKDNILPKHIRGTRRSDRTELDYGLLNPKRRILLVENDTVNQLKLKLFLQKQGFEVHAVGDGNTAIQTLELLPFDLVLMNLYLPDMDGLETTRQIRCLHSAVIDKSIPVIGIGSELRPCTSRECQNKGMSDLVEDPNDTDSLESTLARWLPKNGSDSY